jgi:hypothetical protein
VTLDFIAGRVRFAFYVRKGIVNIPVSKEGTYSRRTRRIDVEIDIFDAALRLGVSLAGAPPPIAQMHVSDFFKK